MRRRSSVVFLPLLAVIVSAIWSSTAWSQRFEIVERSGLVTGTMDLAPGRITVFEGTGERILYSRDYSYDSSDGRFIGYFNYTLNRVLRFPRRGSGPLQTADLDDLVPHFIETTRIVRPVGGWGGGPAFARPWQPIVRPGYGGLYPIAPGGFHPLPSYPLDPYVSGYRPVRPAAQSVLIDSRTVPNPPLPPARVVLRNDGPREIQVGVVDLTNPSSTRSMRIRPNEATEVVVNRDAGAREIRHYRVITPYGESETREVVTEVPPAIRYEVVVHEWAMQSVAIDRTGKSPNVIEDINFQGRGIGRFRLPPGPQLQSGTIDVYRAARSQGNEGTVGPILASEKPSPSDTTSPLERAVFDAQLEAQKRALQRN